MLTLLAAGVLIVALTQQSDTTLAVERGTRLEVENFAGDIAIRTWDRNAVRVSATHSGRDRIEIDQAEGVVSVEPSGRWGVSGIVEFQIEVPRWMPLELSGVKTDVSVEGAGDEVTIETVEGDVTVDGGTGFVSLASVQGSVTLTNARGHIELSSVNEGIRLAEAQGEVSAETVNGEVILERVDSGRVEATTVNGEISYDGTIKDSGSYSFSTHNGDVMVTVPEGANVTVTVATFNGEFQSTFPVTLTDTRRGKRFSFVLGSGRARLELESFQGLLQLRRPGEAPAHELEQEKRKDKPPKPPKPRKPLKPAEAPEPPELE